jgi:hypothetical protein
MPYNYDVSIAEAKPLLKTQTVVGRSRKLMTDDDVPSTANIAQPDWMKRQALFKTRRLTNATRLGSVLRFDPVKAYIESMLNCVKYQNEYSISFTGETNQRSTCALVHRHAGYGTTVGGTDVQNFVGEWAGAKYSDLSGSVESFTPTVITPQDNLVQTLYSPWNARFYESMALKYGVQLPRMAQPTGAEVRPVSDMVADAGNATPHDSQKSPFFNCASVDLDGVNYSIPYNNERYTANGTTDPSNVLPFDNPNGSCRQRHKNGGIELNCINTSAWPQTVDIVQFKCKARATGSNTYQVAGQGQKYMFDPVTNIINNKTQSFVQWKENAKAGQQEVGITDMEASTDFQDYKNVHTSPTWKFLAHYGGNTKMHNNGLQDSGDWIGGTAPMNYAEVERKRVVIPASGSYIFKSEYGGMDYNVINRVNRQFYQEGSDVTNVPVFCSDIAGETIVTFISCSGLQQPGAFVDAELRSFDCTSTPAPGILVKVREYEEVYPWIEIPEKAKPTYTRSLQRMPPSAVPQTIVPSTQWTKNIS